MRPSGPFSDFSERKKINRFLIFLNPIFIIIDQNAKTQRVRAFFKKKEKKRKFKKSCYDVILNFLAACYVQKISIAQNDFI